MEIGYRIATLVLLTVVASISIYYRHRAEREGGKLDRSQGGPLLIALRLVGLAAFLPIVLYIINPAWLPWMRFDLADWLRWLAFAIAAAMVPGIYWLFSTIGNNISPRQTTRVNHQLVTNGPYRYIRHPLYTFGGVFFLAICVGTAIWWSLVLLTVGFGALMWRTPREEQNLIALFGDEYRAYMTRTGRYLPKLG